MILLIDNYDSFSYNLYQLIGSVNPDIQVVRNDEISLGEIEAGTGSNCSFPGPGRPEEAGICIPGDQRVRWKNPNSGCVSGTSEHLRSLWRSGFYTKELKHGKRDEMIQCGSNVLFKGLPKKFWQQDIIPWQQ